MGKEVDIAALTLADLRADQRGILIEQLAELIREVFSEAPWHEDFAVTRLQFGLGVEMMRSNPLLFVARTRNGGNIVGYVLGQEVHRSSDDPRNQTLSGISGGNDLDYLFDGGKRIFYVSGIGVTRPYRRFGIAGRLSQSLINELRKRGFDYRIGRTDTTAHAMRRLYLKQGFQELPITDTHYPNRTYWLLAL